MKRALKGLGLLVLAMTLVVGGVVFRLWRDREEHLRLREADQARAPLSAPKSSRPTFAAPASQATTCLVGVVLDGSSPVAEMQVSASEPPEVIRGAGQRRCGCPACDCVAGRRAILDDPQLGCLDGVRSATTAADGTFALCGLSQALPALLWAEHADGRFALASETAGPLRTDVPVTLRVLPSQPVDGLVVDSEGPLPGATVLFFHEVPTRPFLATTDAAGRFSMTLPLGAGRALVSAPGHPATFISADVTTDGVLVLRLEAVFLLDVRVTHEGRPVEGAEVTVNGGPVERTAATGDAHFELTRGSSHTVRARKGRLVGTASVWPGRLPSRYLELSLAEGLTLRGVIVDEDGTPRAGVVRGAVPGNRPLATDATGQFELEPWPEGDRVWLTAEVPGCTSGSPEGFTIAPRQKRVKLEVRCGASVRGQVLDADGSPVAGARLSTKGADVEVETSSTLTGHFTLQLAPGTVQLLVEHERYRSLQRPVTAPSTSDVILVLDAGGAIAGRVVDEQGQGLAAVKVIAVPAVLDADVFRQEGKAAKSRTDASGRFELRGLEAGRWVVAAVPTGLPVVVSEALALKPGERREGLVLTASGAVDVSGVVVDERQAPVAGASLDFDIGDDKASMMRVVANALAGRLQEAAAFLPRGVVTGADGRFQFRSMPLSSMPLKVRAEGFEDVTRVVTKGEQVRIALTRVARWTITGRVTDDRGAPMPTFQVNSSVFTPADGRFEVDGREEKDTLHLRAPGFLTVQRTVSRALPKADIGTVKLERAKTLSVRVRGPDGPLDRVRVTAKQEGTNEDCETTDLGECLLTPLSDLETTVRVRKKAFTPKELTVPAGALDRPLEVTLEPAGARVVGQVMAAPGRPLAGRRVTVLGPMYENTTTNGEGRFSIAGLTPGFYCASAKLAPGLTAVDWAVPVQVSEAPLEVVVGPIASGGATIELHPSLGVSLVVVAALEASPRPLKTLGRPDADDLCSEWEVPTVKALMTGTTRFEGLPPGVWSVFVVSMDQLADDDALVTPTVVRLGPSETRVVE